MKTDSVSDMNTKLEMSVSALRNNRPAYRLDANHWRCCLGDVSIDIEANPTGMLVLSAPVALTLSDVESALNTYAYISHLKHFEHDSHVFVSEGQGNRGAWEPGASVRVSYQCDPSLLDQGEFDQIIENVADDARDAGGVLRSLASGLIGLADAVKEADGLFQLEQFIEGTREQEGRSLVPDDGFMELANKHKPNLESLFPPERPSYLLSTKLVSLKTTCVGEAISVLRAGGRAFPVNVSWRTPWFAEATIDVACSIGADPEDAALAAASCALDDSLWESLCVHALYGRTVLHVRLESWELSSDRLDSFFGQAVDFLGAHGAELSKMLDTTIGYGEDNPKVLIARPDGVDDVVRYDFAREVFCAGIVHTNDLQGNKSWLSGGEAFTVLYTKFDQDMLLIDVRIWLDVTGPKGASELERLRRRLDHRYSRGRTDWWLHTTAGQSLDDLGYVHLLCGRLISEVLGSKGGLKAALDHAERTASRVKPVLEGIGGSTFSARKAARMIDVMETRRLEGD